MISKLFYNGIICFLFHVATRNAQNTAPPPYTPPTGPWYAAPPPAYQPSPQGYYGWMPPTDVSNITQSIICVINKTIKYIFLTSMEVR